MQQASFAREEKSYPFWEEREKKWEGIAPLSNRSPERSLL